MTRPGQNLDRNVIGAASVMLRKARGNISCSAMNDNVVDEPVAASSDQVFVQVPHPPETVQVVRAMEVRLIDDGTPDRTRNRGVCVDDDLVFGCQEGIGAHELSSVGCVRRGREVGMCATCSRGSEKNHTVAQSGKNS